MTLLTKSSARVIARWRTLCTALSIFAGLFASGYFVAYAFHIAAAGGNRDAMFGFFWVGILAGLIPLVIFASARGTTSMGRFVAIVGIAVVTTMPKILRTFESPLFHDEYAHLRAVLDILTTGKPGAFNSIVTPVPYFPALHLLTAWLVHLTDWGVWAVAMSVVAVAHVSALCGLVVLLRTLGFSFRSAAIGSAIYATNANWMYFDAQFAYESLALPLVIWGLVLAARISLIRASWLRWLVVLAFGPIGYLIADVHHLSSMDFVGFMTVIAIFVVVRRIRSGDRRFATIEYVVAAVLAIAGVALRLVPIWSLIQNYLGSPIGNGASQVYSAVSNALGLGAESVGSRSLFAGSRLPDYERVAGYAMPIAFSVVLISVVVIWVRHRRGAELSLPAGTPVRNAFIGVSLLYFCSLPFLLTTSGAEGGRRSWVYSVVGVAALIALLCDTFFASSRGMKVRFRLPSWIGWIGWIVVWSTLLVGGVATGANEGYRFPERVSGVSDITASTSEARSLGNWFALNTARNTWVITDRYSGLDIASYGGAQIAPASAAFPYWDLYFYGKNPSTPLMAEVAVLHVQYLVVDTRLASVEPDNGFWFSSLEPQPNGAGKPVTSVANLDRLANVPWLTAVYASTHYTVYQFHLERYNPYEPTLERKSGPTS